MRITDIESTDLFGGTSVRPLQIIRVTLTGTGDRPDRDRDARVAVRVEGPGVSTPVPATIDLPDPGARRTAEVCVEIAAPHRPGSVRSVTVIAEAPGSRAETGAEITAAEPGWTMWMVSHFHYDPVWWDTQGQFTESRLMLPDERGNLPAARTAFELVRLHLEAARQDPDYKFVLAELDYLKPHFDVHPEDRADLRRFIAEGRIEIVGGSYNEPNTNLTSAESTIRNAIYGIGFQRDVLGGDPRTAWMLDAFGFDPGYPGLMAAAGLTTSAWARGPFHQWGPNRTVGDNRRMQFPSEFEWISPDGGGLVTSYMANHYGAGWVTHHAPDLPAAEKAAYEQFRELAPVAATPNVLLPVGSDHVIPSRWATRIHRDWNERYLWPRFVMALPSEFFAAVRRDADAANTWMTPQTRDMNPVYTGKDVSYIDTKQAQRAGETAVTSAERLATLAWLTPPPDTTPGYRYPAESLDKAWRQLVFGAHHDAITGTESDQVYLDLLGGWREAWQRGHEACEQAASHLAGLIGTASADHGAVVVFNTLPRVRTAMATVTLSLPPGVASWITLAGPPGRTVPCLAEGITRHGDGSLAGLTLTFRAADLPPLGYRSYPIVPAGQEPRYPGWQVVPGATVIENDALSVAVDPARGGALSRVRDKRQDVHLLRQGAVGNELVLQEEYANHPKWNEGQWLLSPKGAGRGLADRPVVVRAERCPVGSRLVSEFSEGDLHITQETLLWDGAERVEFRTHVDGSIGQDRLLRVRFPADVPGGLPIYQTATAVIGRPPGAADGDVADHWFTLDNPAYQWLGVGSTARVRLPAAAGGGAGPAAAWLTQAIGVAEVIPPLMSFENANGARPAQAADAGPDSRQSGEDVDAAAVRAVVRELMATLAGQGVTATCSRPDGPRYGAIDVDSNLPDVRIALGDGDQNPFTAEVLAAADPACAKELQEQLQQTGSARLWVPATRTREDVFAPGTDARGPRDLPVLIVAGRGPGGLAAAIGQVTAALAMDSAVEAAGDAGQACVPLADRSVALLNRGTPSGLVTPDGTLHVSLMRSCSAWPSGVWIDGERRTAPDGSSFNWQHWTHTFEYALAAGPGDWRTAGFNAAAEEYNQDVVTCQTGTHDGPLPAQASLCSVDPPEVTLTALKPRGNPLASGRPGSPDPSGGILVRLRETAGRPARARVSLTGAGGARHTDLLEQAEGDPLPAEGGTAIVDLSPAGLASVIMAAGPAGPAGGTRARIAPAAPGAGAEPAVLGAGTRLAAPGGETEPGVPGAGAEHALPGAATEPAQPVFTRYWLHGKGPAPAGNLPVAVHISPGRCAVTTPGGAAPADAGLDREARLRVTVGCGVEPAAGRVQLDVPPGLTAAHEQPLDFDLPAGGHAGWDVTVRAAPGASGGRYFVAARILDSLGQVTEDAALVAVGEPASPDLSLPLAELLPLIEADQQAGEAEISVTLLSQDITLAPGQRGELAVRIGNRLASQLRGEAQLISPPGSWQALGSWTQSLAAGPGQDITISYPVTMPATARPGAHWWAVVKVMYFGRVRYTPAVPIVVSR